MNGYAEFFNKFDLFSRSSLIAILILTVFWYAGMAVAARDSFAVLDIPLRIALAFCLAVYWICFHTFFVSMVSTEAKRHDSPEALTRNAAAQSIIFFGAPFLVHFDDNLQLGNFIFLMFMYFWVLAVLTVITVHFSNRLAARRQATR